MLVSSGTGIIGPRSWSGDGTTLIFMDTDLLNFNIGTVSVKGNHEKKLLLRRGKRSTLS
jgi:hypothetical protein